MAEPISAACGAWDDLWGAGFPDPVVGDSGNGTHLLYPVDLPNDSDIICLGEAPEETASTARPAGDRGYDGEKSSLKQEDYSNICAVTHQLMELTPPSSDRRTTSCSRAWS